MKYYDRRVIITLISVALSFVIYYLFYANKSNESFENIHQSMVTIQFNDNNFYNSVKEQITTSKYADDKELTITMLKNDIQTIKSFTFSEFTGSAIKDISGIRYFTALTQLTLQDSNYLTDISELAYLTNLEYLYLDNNKLISDLSPISELKKLRKLDLDYSNSMKNIKNINAIANLTELEYLDTSVYNMDYDMETVENKDATFKLPAIFSVAQKSGGNIKLDSDNTIDVKYYNNQEIKVSATNNGTVSISINGGVYDKITCTINFIVKDIKNS